MKLINFVKNNNGYLLIWTLIVMSVLLILGISILNVTSAEVNHATRSDKQIQVDYIARSGAEDAFDVLNSESQAVSESIANESMEDLATYLNNNYSSDWVNLGSGSYEYTFDDDSYYPSYLKIISKAKHQDNKIDSTVSLYVLPDTIFTEDGWSMPPESWLRAMNLNPDVSPEIEGDDATGSLVNFSDYTKSPQNDDDLSTFRATVIRFTGLNNKGVTFEQIKNTNSITFDAEIIVFGGDVYLNDETREVNLGVSEDVLEEKKPIPHLTYEEEVGFEDIDRYNAFVYPNEIDESEHGSYGFESDTHYGVVAFGGKIEHKNDGILLNSVSTNIDLHKVSSYDMYFYPHNLDLNSLDDELVKDKLTLITDNTFKNSLSNKMGIAKFAIGDNMEKKLFILEE